MDVTKTIMGGQKLFMEGTGFFKEFFDIPPKDENTRKVWEMARKDLGKNPTQAKQFQVDQKYGMGQMDKIYGMDEGEEPAHVAREDQLSEVETNEIF